MELFKFRRFLQSKTVNSVCKLFQLLGDEVPQTPTRPLPLDPSGGLLPPDSLGYSPQMNTLRAATVGGVVALAIERPKELTQLEK